MGIRDPGSVNAGIMCAPTLPPAAHFPCPQPWLSTYKREVRHPHPYPIWDSPLQEQRIFVTASRWRSRVEKLILDSDGDCFLLLPLFDSTPVSRDIDCWIFGENKWNLGGRRYFVPILTGLSRTTPNFCWCQYLSTHNFCLRQYFVDVYILSTPMFNDYLMNLLLMIVFCTYHDYY